MSYSVYLAMLLGGIIGLRCNIGILVIALVTALTIMAAVEVGLGHGLGSVVQAVVFGSFAIQAGYLAGLGVRGLIRAYAAHTEGRKHLIPS